MSIKTKSILIIFIFLLSGFSGFLLSLYTHQYDKIQPNVQVIQTFHDPETFVHQLKGDKKAGEKIFKAYCTSCHGKTPIIDVPAPRIGDAKSWRVRRKLELPLLLKITISGVGAMPARGGCFECSDEQLQETIQYILNETLHAR